MVKQETLHGNNSDTKREITTPTGHRNLCFTQTNKKKAIIKKERQCTVRATLCYANDVANDRRLIVGYVNAKQGHKHHTKTPEGGTNNDDADTATERHIGSHPDNFFLSPLYVAPFVARNGQRYQSVAHFIQAAKFTEDAIYRELILETERPLHAIHLGHHTMPRPRKNDPTGDRIRRIVQHRRECGSHHSRRSDWQCVRECLFKRATLLKFTQNPALGRALIETAPHDIVEDTDDAYWGRGGGDDDDERISGQNRAGKCLMDVRQTLLELSLHTAV